MLISQATNSTVQTNTPQTQALLTFTVAGQQCGLPVTNIERIVDMVALTGLPGASEVIAGLVNVQGKVIPALDLRLRFGLPRQPYTLQTPMIIANTPYPGGTLALIVDTVEEVVEVSPEQLTATDAIIPVEMVAPGTIPGTFFTGVATIRQKLILILNVGALLTPAEHHAMLQAPGNHNEIKQQKANGAES